MLSESRLQGSVVMALLLLSCSGGSGTDAGTMSSDAGTNAGDAGRDSCGWSGTITPWTGVTFVTSLGVLMELSSGTTRIFPCLSKPPTQRAESIPLTTDESQVVRLAQNTYSLGFSILPRPNPNSVIFEGADAVRRRPTDDEGRMLAGPTDDQGRDWAMEWGTGGTTVSVFDAAGAKRASGTLPAVTTVLHTKGSSVFAIHQSSPAFDLVTSVLSADLATGTVTATERVRRPRTEMIAGVSWVRFITRRTSFDLSSTPRGIPSWRTKSSGGVTTTVIELLDVETLSPLWASAAITSRTGDPVSLVLQETPNHLAVWFAARLSSDSGAQVVNGVTASTWQSPFGIVSAHGFLLLISWTTKAVELVVPDFNSPSGFAMDPAGGFFVPLHVGGAAGGNSLARYGPDLKKDYGVPPDVTAAGFDCTTQSYAALTDVQASNQCKSACTACAAKYLPNGNTGAPRTAAEVAQLQAAVDSACSILKTSGTDFENRCAFCPVRNPQCR